jgi:3-oxoacyl-[acyl-carrier protein] reductase
MFGTMTDMDDAQTPRRVALVTGGAQGLGLASGARLARDGWTVVLADRQAQQVEQAAGDLAASGLAVSAAALDVTDSEQAAAVVAATLERHGRLDALVNNAGILRDRPLPEMSDEDFRIVIDVCLFGSFCLARAVAPAMIEQGWGRIVNMASRAYLGNPGQANYSAAKAGVVGLTKALAKELGRHGITVNAVAPGMSDTEMVRNHPRAERIVERAIAANSVPRIGTEEDVAAAVAYLCSAEAGFITGDVLHLSGGRFD